MCNNSLFFLLMFVCACVPMRVLVCLNFLILHYKVKSLFFHCYELRPKRKQKKVPRRADYYLSSFRLKDNRKRYQHPTPFPQVTSTLQHIRTQLSNKFDITSSITLRKNYFAIKKKNNRVMKSKNRDQ